jgi:hypothetical protein
MTLFKAVEAQEASAPPLASFDPTPIPAAPQKAPERQQITPEELERAEKLGSKTFFLKLSFGLFGNSKKIPRGEVKVDADEDSVSSNKRLLDSPELQAIKDADAELSARIDLLTLPSFEIDEDGKVQKSKGLKFLPLAAFDRVDELLRDHTERRPLLIEKFVRAYPKLCTQAPGKLRSIFEMRNYPGITWEEEDGQPVARLTDPDRVREKFRFAYRYVQIDTPGKLASLSSKAFEEEREKAARTLTSAADEIDRFMVTTFAAMVERLKASLTDGPDGKKKKLYDTAVTGLKEFIETFNLRNVNSYGELEAQINKARAIMAGVPDVDALREVESLRAKVREGMEAVSSQLDGMVKAKPLRKFRDDLEN